MKPEAPARRFRRLRRLLMASVVTATFGGVLATVLFTAAWVLFPLPDRFLAPGDPGALVLDASGGVLLDIVGADEQHRLAITLEQAGPWIPEALIAVEDHAFRSHIGIDPGAILGALGSNLAAGKVVRGGSTITMQVAGLRLQHPRTYAGKAIEAFRALQIEARHDKDRILEAWLNTASFGGNLVGIETASRAWLGKPAAACSIAEAALLVGLPNAPERFRPDRHPEAAIRRKNIVLDRMLASGVISSAQHQVARAEELLIHRRDSSGNRRHVGWVALQRSGRGRVLETTVDPTLQAVVESVVEQHARDLPTEVDISVVLVEVASGSIRAMVGSTDPMDPRDGQVNGATSRRSPGSSLKPLIYAMAYDRHRLAPESIVLDAPLDYAGWRPGNIDRRYRGRMTAAEALRSSRNTPALRITDELGLASVIAGLRRSGIALPLDTAGHAGLSIAVGGVEVRPLDLAEAYTMLARGGLHQPLRLIESEPATPTRVFSTEACRAVECSLAPDPGLEGGALPFVVAKTGTSSGLRDALAAGWNARYAVVTWVGRFDGGSDPILMGSRSALPILDSLLTHPTLRTNRPTRKASDWIVRNQVGAGLATTLPRLLEPRNGDCIVASGTTVRIDPRIETDGRPTVLLLDGRPIELGPITVGIGTHELRVISGTNPPHTIEFTVEPLIRTVSQPADTIEADHAMQ